MQSYLPVIVMILLASTLPGQTSDRIVLQPEALCEVAGRVVTAAEGSPLKAARVALIPEQSRTDTEIYATNSDSDGNFKFKGIPAGRYRFFAVRSGFVEEMYPSNGAEEGAVLSLKTGQKIKDVLFRMTRAAVIAGRVTNEDGEPLVGVQITALQRPTDDEIEDEPRPSHKRDLRSVAGSKTDDRGEYRIFGLKPGEYYLRVSDRSEPSPGAISVYSDYWLQRQLGSEYAPVYYPSAGQLGQAEAVSVRPGDELQADIAMRRIKTVEISGRVLGLNGPAQHAYVTLDSADQDSFSSRYDGTVDEKGSFTLKGVPPGSYVLTVYQPPEGQYVYERTARQKVEVVGENIESLNVSLGVGATLRGRVTVSGPGTVTFDRIRVALDAIHEDVASGDRVKKDGTFEITSVSDGNYRVNVWGLEREWYVKSARLGPEDVLENGLQVENGATGGRLEIVVSSASAELEGAVSHAVLIFAHSTT